jgi:hypothetical protein
MAKQLVNVSRTTLYLGVDVRHPQPARCTRHPLCSNVWHSPRNCPNMALARMSPYGTNGADSEESPPDTDAITDKAQTSDDAQPKHRSHSPGKDSPKRRTSGTEQPARGGANTLEKAHSFAAVGGCRAARVH